MELAIVWKGHIAVSGFRGDKFIGIGKGLEDALIIF